MSNQPPSFNLSPFPQRGAVPKSISIPSPIAGAPLIGRITPQPAHSPLPIRPLVNTSNSNFSLTGAPATLLPVNTPRPPLQPQQGRAQNKNPAPAPTRGGIALPPRAGMLVPQTSNVANSLNSNSPVPSWKLVGAHGNLTFFFEERAGLIGKKSTYNNTQAAFFPLENDNCKKHGVNAVLPTADGKYIIALGNGELIEHQGTIAEKITTHLGKAQEGSFHHIGRCGNHYILIDSRGDIYSLNRTPGQAFHEIKLVKLHTSITGAKPSCFHCDEQIICVGEGSSVKLFTYDPTQSQALIQIDSFVTGQRISCFGKFKTDSIDGLVIAEESARGCTVRLLDVYRKPAASEGFPQLKTANCGVNLVSAILQYENVLIVGCKNGTIWRLDILGPNAPTYHLGTLNPPQEIGHLNIENNTVVIWSKQGQQARIVLKKENVQAPSSGVKEQYEFSCYLFDTPSDAQDSQRFAKTVLMNKKGPNQREVQLPKLPFIVNEVKVGSSIETYCWLGADKLVAGPATEFAVCQTREGRSNISIWKKFKTPSNTWMFESISGTSLHLSGTVIDCQFSPKELVILKQEGDEAKITILDRTDRFKTIGSHTIPITAQTGKPIALKGILNLCYIAFERAFLTYDTTEKRELNRFERTDHYANFSSIDPSPILDHHYFGTVDGKIFRLNPRNGSSLQVANDPRLARFANKEIKDFYTLPVSGDFVITAQDDSSLYQEIIPLTKLTFEKVDAIEQPITTPGYNFILHRLNLVGEELASIEPLTLAQKENVHDFNVDNNALEIAFNIQDRQIDIYTTALGTTKIASHDKLFAFGSFAGYSSSIWQRNSPHSLSLLQKATNLIPGKIVGIKPVDANKFAVLTEDPSGVSALYYYGLDGVVTEVFTVSGQAIDFVVHKGILYLCFAKTVHVIDLAKKESPVAPIYILNQNSGAAFRSIAVDDDALYVLLSNGALQCKKHLDRSFRTTGVHLFNEPLEKFHLLGNEEILFTSRTNVGLHFFVRSLKQLTFIADPQTIHTQAPLRLAPLSEKKYNFSYTHLNYNPNFLTNVQVEMDSVASASDTNQLSLGEIPLTTALSMSVSDGKVQIIGWDQTTGLFSFGNRLAAVHNPIVDKSVLNLWVFQENARTTGLKAPLQNSIFTGKIRDVQRVGESRYLVLREYGAYASLDLYNGSDAPTTYFRMSFDKKMGSPKGFALLDTVFVLCFEHVAVIYDVVQLKEIHRFELTSKGHEFCSVAANKNEVYLASTQGEIYRWSPGENTLKVARPLIPLAAGNRAIRKMVIQDEELFLLTLQTTGISCTVYSLNKFYYEATSFIKRLTSFFLTTPESKELTPLIFPTVSNNNNAPLVKPAQFVGASGQDAFFFDGAALLHKKISSQLLNKTSALFSITPLDGSTISMNAICKIPDKAVPLDRHLIAYSDGSVVFYQVGMTNTTIYKAVEPILHIGRCGDYYILVDKKGDIFCLLIDWSNPAQKILPMKLLSTTASAKATCLYCDEKIVGVGHDNGDIRLYTFDPMRGASALLEFDAANFQKDPVTYLGKFKTDSIDGILAGASGGTLHLLDLSQARNGTLSENFGGRGLRATKCAAGIATALQQDNRLFVGGNDGTIWEVDLLSKKDDVLLGKINPSQEIRHLYLENNTTLIGLCTPYHQISIALNTTPAAQNYQFKFYGVGVLFANDLTRVRKEFNMTQKGSTQVIGAINEPKGLSISGQGSSINTHLWPDAEKAIAFGDEFVLCQRKDGNISTVTLWGPSLASASQSMRFNRSAIYNFQPVGTIVDFQFYQKDQFIVLTEEGNEVKLTKYSPNSGVKIVPLIRGVDVYKSSTTPKTGKSVSFVGTRGNFHVCFERVFISYNPADQKELYRFELPDTCSNFSCMFIPANSLNVYFGTVDGKILRLDKSNNSLQIAKDSRVEYCADKKIKSFTPIGNNLVVITAHGHGQLYQEVVPLGQLTFEEIAAPQTLTPMQIEAAPSTGYNFAIHKVELSGGKQGAKMVAFGNRSNTNTFQVSNPPKEIALRIKDRQIDAFSSTSGYSKIAYTENLLVISDFSAFSLGAWKLTDDNSLALLSEATYFQGKILAIQALNPNTFAVLVEQKEAYALYHYTPLSKENPVVEVYKELNTPYGIPIGFCVHKETLYLCFTKAVTVYDLGQKKLLDTFLLLENSPDRFTSIAVDEDALYIGTGNKSLFLKKQGEPWFKKTTQLLNMSWIKEIRLLGNQDILLVNGHQAELHMRIVSLKTLPIIDTNSVVSISTSAATTTEQPSGDSYNYSLILYSPPAPLTPKKIRNGTITYSGTNNSFEFGQMAGTSAFSLSLTGREAKINAWLDTGGLFCYGNRAIVIDKVKSDKTTAVTLWKMKENAAQISYEHVLSALPYKGTVVDVQPIDDSNYLVLTDSDNRAGLYLESFSGLSPNYLVVPYDQWLGKPVSFRLIGNILGICFEHMAIFYDLAQQKEIQRFQLLDSQTHFSCMAASANEVYIGTTNGQIFRWVIGEYITQQTKFPNAVLENTKIREMIVNDNELFILTQRDSKLTCQVYPLKDLSYESANTVRRQLSYLVLSLNPVLTARIVPAEQLKVDYHFKFHRCTATNAEGSTALLSLTDSLEQTRGFSVQRVSDDAALNIRFEKESVNIVQWDGIQGLKYSDDSAVTAEAVADGNSQLTPWLTKKESNKVSFERDLSFAQTVKGKIIDFYNTLYGQIVLTDEEDWAYCRSYSPSKQVATYGIKITSDTGKPLGFMAEGPLFYFVFEKMIISYNITAKTSSQFALSSDYSGHFSCFGGRDQIYIGTTKGDIFRWEKGSHTFTVAKLTAPQFQNRPIKKIRLNFLNQDLLIASQQDKTLHFQIFSKNELTFEQTSDVKVVSDLVSILGTKSTEVEKMKLISFMEHMKWRQARFSLKQIRDPKNATSPEALPMEETIRDKVKIFTTHSAYPDRAFIGQFNNLLFTGTQVSGSKIAHEYGIDLLATRVGNGFEMIIGYRRDKNGSSDPSTSTIFSTVSTIKDFRYYPSQDVKNKSILAVLSEKDAQTTFSQHNMPYFTGGAAQESFVVSTPTSGSAVCFFLENPSSNLLYLCFEKAVHIFDRTTKKIVDGFKIDDPEDCFSSMTMTRYSICVGTKKGRLLRRAFKGGKVEVGNLTDLGPPATEISRLVFKDNLLYIVTQKDKTLQCHIFPSQMLRFEPAANPTEIDLPATVPAVIETTATASLSETESEGQKTFKRIYRHLAFKIAAHFRADAALKNRLLELLIGANYKWEPGLSIDDLAPVIQWGLNKYQGERKELFARALAHCLTFFGIREITSLDEDFKQRLQNYLPQDVMGEVQAPGEPHLFTYPKVLASTLYHIKLKELKWNGNSVPLTLRESTPSFIFQKAGASFLFYSMSIAYDPSGHIRGFNADSASSNLSLIESILMQRITGKNGLFELTSEQTLQLMEHIKDHGLHTPDGTSFLLIPAFSPPRDKEEEENVNSNNNNSIRNVRQKTASSHNPWVNREWLQDDISTEDEESTDEEAEEIAPRRAHHRPKESLTTNKEEFEVHESVKQNFLALLGVTQLGRAIRRTKLRKRSPEAADKPIAYPNIENFWRAIQNPVQPDFFLDNKLKPYQKEAVAKLLALIKEKAPGAVSAQEMGLGKTIISIELLFQMAEKSILFISPKPTHGQTTSKVKSTLVQGIIDHCQKALAANLPENAAVYLRALEDLDHLNSYLQNWSQEIDKALVRVKEPIKQAALKAEREQIQELFNQVGSATKSIEPHVSKRIRLKPEARRAALNCLVKTEQQDLKRAKAFALLNKLKSTDEDSKGAKVSITQALQDPEPFLFITTEQLKTQLSELQKKNWDLILFDEAHKGSNNEESGLSKSFEQLLEQQSRRPFVNLLSGTVFQNQIKDYLNILIYILGNRGTLDQEFNDKILGNIDSMINKMQMLCTPDLRQQQKTKMISGLYSQLRTTFAHLLGLKKLEILVLNRENKDDPRIQEQWANLRPTKNVIPVDLTPTEAQVSINATLSSPFETVDVFNEDVAGFLGLRSKAQRATIHPDLVEDMSETMVENTINSKTQEELAAWVQKSALLKFFFLNPNSPLKVKTMEKREPTVIFVTHLSSGHVIEKLVRRYFKGFNPEVTFLNGATKNRDAIVKAFNATPIKNPRVLIATWETGGVGLDLREGTQVHPLELDFNPAITQQGLNRVDRMGIQKLIDLYLYNFGDDFYQEHFKHIIQKKEKMRDWLLPRQKESAVTEENVCEKLIQLFDVLCYRLAKKYFTDEGLKAEVQAIRSRLLGYAEEDETLMDLVENANPLKAYEQPQAEPMEVEAVAPLPLSNNNNAPIFPWYPHGVPVVQRTALVQATLPLAPMELAQRTAGVAGKREASSSDDEEPLVLKKFKTHNSRV